MLGQRLCLARTCWAALEATALRGQNQSNPHLAGLTFAVDVRPRGSDGHARDPWSWGWARLSLQGHSHSTKLDPAHAQSSYAALLLVQGSWNGSYLIDFTVL